MSDIRNWTIARSGASLTIEGVDSATGEPVKITRVTRVSAGHPFPTATDQRGQTHTLGSAFAAD